MRRSVCIVHCVLQEDYVCCTVLSVNTSLTGGTTEPKLQTKKGVLPEENTPVPERPRLAVALDNPERHDQHLADQAQ